MLLSACWYVSSVSSITVCLTGIFVRYACIVMMWDVM